MTETYFNGYKDIEVHDFEHLKELSQEETNSIVVGPQETFFQKLEEINRALSYSGGEEIDVTKKWNWRPGHYDRMRSYLTNKLDINKKSKNMAYLVDRTMSRNNYLQYIARQVRAMERERDELKRLSIPYDVNLDEFKETCILYTDEIYRQCKIANDLSKGNIIIEPKLFIDGRRICIILDILLTGLEMEIYSGDNSTAKIPLNTIHIIGITDLRRILAGGRASIEFKGKYFSDDISYAFPYIGQDRYQNGTYGVVCLDRYGDDIEKAFNNKNYGVLAMNLMQWAQYYSLSHSNPYNQPYRLHYGMPGYFSKAYRNSQDNGAVIQQCSKILRGAAEKQGYIGMHLDKYINNKCYDIDCALMDTCSLHKTTVKTLSIYESDTYYEIESIVGMIHEHLLFAYGEAGNYSDLVAIGAEIENITARYVNQDTENYQEDVIDSLIHYLVNDWHNGWNYAYEWLVKVGQIENSIKDIPVTSNMEDDEIETLMKLWVESQRS